MRDSTLRTHKAHTHAGEAFAALLHSDSADMEPVAAALTRAGQDVARPHGALLLADLGGGTGAAEKAAARLCTAIYVAVRCPVQLASPAHVAVVVPVLAPGLWSTGLQAARNAAETTWRRPTGWSWLLGGASVTPLPCGSAT